MSDATHFLAINHESYDSSTVFGVFDSFIAARDHLEADAANPKSFSSASIAEVEEWVGSEQIAVHSRDPLSPALWARRELARRGSL